MHSIGTNLKSSKFRGERALMISWQGSGNFMSSCCAARCVGVGLERGELGRGQRWALEVDEGGRCW